MNIVSGRRDTWNVLARPQNKNFDHFHRHYCHCNTSEHKLWPLGKDFGHLVARIGEHVTSGKVWVGGVGEGGGGGGWRQRGGVEERLDGDKVALRTSSPAVLSSVGTFIKEG